jgi:hypothetical protein
MIVRRLHTVIGSLEDLCTRYISSSGTKNKIASSMSMAYAASPTIRFASSTWDVELDVADKVFDYLTPTGAQLPLLPPRCPGIRTDLPWGSALTVSQLWRHSQEDEFRTQLSTFIPIL